MVMMLASGGRLPVQAQSLPGEPPTAPKPAYELPAEMADRLSKLLPFSFPRLNQRQPCQIAVIGNTLTDLSPEPAGTRPLDAFPGAFARELANQFYFTGGVRLLDSPASTDTPAGEARGPELALRYLGRQDVTVFTASEALATYGSQAKPQILLLCLGLEESRLDTHPLRFAGALDSLLDVAAELQIDVILAGPPLPASPPIEVSFGLTRSFTSILREKATARSLPFVDLGDLSQILPLAPELTEPAPIFETLSTAYKAAGDAALAGEGGLHARLGKMILNALTENAPPAPCKTTPASLQLQADGRLKAAYQLENSTDTDLSVAQFPLVTRRWKPVETEAAITIPAGKSTTVEILYEPSSSGVTTSNFRPSDETVERLPILWVVQGLARISDLAFRWTPIAVTWDSDTFFNVDETFVIKGSITNTSGSDIAGRWSSSWHGQKTNGELKLPAGASERLEIELAFPKDIDSHFRIRESLTLDVTMGGESHSFERPIEMVHNLGLRKAVPLSLSASQAAPIEPKAPGISLKIEADPGMLFLTCLIDDIPLHDNPADGIAWQWLINLDARTYGKRLGPGATRSLRLRGGAADGEVAVDAIAPWAFGSGYAAEFDPAEIKARLDSTLTGQRRLTVAIPRSYLYLHEWALGNGNSQLGIDMNLELWRALNRRSDPAVDTEIYRLTGSSRHPDDAEGLAVLELTPEPTSRWTVLPD